MRRTGAILYKQFEDTGWVDVQKAMSQAVAEVADVIKAFLAMKGT